MIYIIVDPQPHLESRSDAAPLKLVAPRINVALKINVAPMIKDVQRTNAALKSSIVRMKITTHLRQPIIPQRMDHQTTCHLCSKGLLLLQPILLSTNNTKHLLHRQLKRSIPSTGENGRGNANGWSFLHHLLRLESLNGLRGRWMLTKTMMMMVRMRRKEE
jgi:hypothetical protein